MDDADIDLRNATYAAFVARGRAPTAEELADERGCAREEIVSGWRRLHVDHALVLNQATDELRMVNPFSAVPTAYRVRTADRRWWYANCAWDAFGICAALDLDGRIETSCPDCAEPVTVDDVDCDRLPDDTSLLFHCLVPAVRWWNDIVFT